jgi:hypothetical protein
VIGCSSSPKPSAKDASRKLHDRMSSPSSQNIGSDELLPWSCQVMAGVMTKSPGSIVVFSPSTACGAPLPSRTKRRADWLCRCAGATSPGMTSWTPA